MWTSSGIEFNIYWTSDFNPTLIAFMGGNVAGESADDEPEVETVNVTVIGGTADPATVTKGAAARIVITPESADGTTYTVQIGDAESSDLMLVDGKLTVELTAEQTGSDVTITVSPKD